ncbi:MAG: hypothetical protein ACR2OO_09595, partial [Thermomicrobiales bacterium]
MARRDIDAELIAKVRTFNLTRRGFIGAGAAVAGLTIIGNNDILAAGRGAPGASLGRRHDQPKPGGTLKIATSTDPVGLDPM